MNFPLPQKFQIKGKTQTDILGLKNITENKKFTLWVDFTKSLFPNPPPSFCSRGSGPHSWPLLPVSPPLVPSKLCCRVMFFTCDRSCQSSFPKPIRGSFLTEELRFLCRHRYPPRFYCGPSIQVTSPVSPQNPFYSSQATHPSLTLSFFKFFFFFFLSIRNGHLQFFLIIPAVFTGRNPTYLSRSILECDLLDEALIYLYNHDYCLLLC